MIFCSVCRLPIIEEASHTRETCGHICHERCTERRSNQPCTQCTQSTQRITNDASMIHASDTGDPFVCMMNTMNETINSNISNIDKILECDNDNDNDNDNGNDNGSRGASAAIATNTNSNGACVVPGPDDVSPLMMWRPFNFGQSTPSAQSTPSSSSVSKSKKKNKSASGHPSSGGDPSATSKAQKLRDIFCSSSSGGGGVRGVGEDVLMENNNNAIGTNRLYDEPWWLLEAIIICLLGSVMLWVMFEFEH